MPRHYNPSVVLVCAFCGKSFSVIAARASKARYCNLGCRHADMAARRVTGTAEYKAWRAIKDRCLNPRIRCYPDYGGRGITVCDRWRDSFADFLADVGRRPSPGHSIDRTDNDGHYEPGNVAWRTRVEQQSNRRCNRLLTLNGMTRTLSQWALLVGISKEGLWGRLEHGWSVERALTTPK